MAGQNATLALWETRGFHPSPPPSGGVLGLHGSVRGGSKASTSPTRAATNRSALSSSSTGACRTRPNTGSSRSGRSRARTTWPASMRSSAGRYARLKEEGARMPGLILVDGGKPQLSAALAGARRRGRRGDPRDLPGQTRGDHLHAEAPEGHPARPDLRPP